jgi:hypothetical protein
MWGLPAIEYQIVLRWLRGLEADLRAHTLRPRGRLGTMMR